MPGFAGIISKNNPNNRKSELPQMIKIMMHESFYVSGTYLNDRLGIYAGWVCHKGSFSDCMPIVNEKKNILLFIWGESFAEKNLINHLRASGHEFDDSNASYLIHLYEENGADFLQKLNGWFSGILVDLRTGNVLLFNDRFGMQRIYYYECEDGFFFSSEAKSLLKVRPELRKIDLESLSEFFSFGCTLQDKSLFSNVYLLPGGSAWKFSVGKGVKKDSYFRPSDWEGQPSLEKERFYSILKETFVGILPKYFYSKEQIAVSLTGGLDTRMILACRNNPPGSLPCYTFGGMYRDSFDVKVARKVANACNQSHQVLKVDRNFLSEFSNLAEKTVYIADGSIDLTGVPELYVNRLAREVAPIRMTGNYGGEVFRSVRAVKPTPQSEWLFKPDFEKYLHQAMRNFEEVSRCHQLSFAVFKLAPWWGYGRLAIEQSQVTLRTPFMDNDLVALMYQAPADIFSTKEVTQRLIADCNPTLASILTDRGIGQSDVPLSRLTQAYYEFLFKAEYAYDYGMPQWLARLNRVAAPLQIEKMFLGRHKFYHFRTWFRDELSDYVKEMLLDEKTLGRPYWNREYLRKIVNDHTMGYRNHTMEIIKILTVELTHRLLIEQR